MVYVRLAVVCAVILGYTAFSVWYAWKTWQPSSRRGLDCVGQRRKKDASRWSKAMSIVLLVIALLIWAVLGMSIYAVTHMRIVIGPF